MSDNGRLDDIGFYTLCEERCHNLSDTSPMWRCELILTDRCNFQCGYCRGLRTDCRGDVPRERALAVLGQWIDDGLKHVRFSGGEPTLYPGLDELVWRARACDRVALSTNGSAPLSRYMELVSLGVNDFSISLDACCAAQCGKMAGISAETMFRRLTENIRELAPITYVTVGVVLTDENHAGLAATVEFAHNLGVADIRIIPAAQNGNTIAGVEKIPPHVLDAHPILAYRVCNLRAGRPVRSIQEYDSHRCYIPMDDSAVAGRWHFPCVIYLREGGDPIGEVGPDMRAERVAWSENHDTFSDPICRANCLDVCVDHNNQCYRQDTQQRRRRHERAKDTANV
jgi:molybdenum cofactor biosynthesis enzyme MoaA